MRKLLSTFAAVGLVGAITVAEARVYVSGGVVIRQPPISIGYSSPAYNYRVTPYYRPSYYYPQYYYPKRYYRSPRYNHRRSYRGSSYRNRHYYRRW